jgi:hypothetical protein
MIVFGTGPDDLGQPIVEIASLPPGEQLEVCRKRWIWLYTSTQTRML